jgi:hypothetical protein
LESLAEIQQLPYRYALAVDSRNLDALVGLFVPNVRVGRNDQGREALKVWFSDVLSHLSTTIHFVGNHIIDFNGPDDAQGIVYCRDELERPERGEWEIGVIQYWDTYRRVEGHWCFERRQLHRWYIVDALNRPGPGLGVEDANMTVRRLPEAFESWTSFWKEHRL